MEKIIEKIKKELQFDDALAFSMAERLMKVSDELKPSIEKWLNNESDIFCFSGYSLYDIIEKDHCTMVQAILRMNSFMMNEEAFAKYMLMPFEKE